MYPFLMLTEDNKMMSWQGATDDTRFLKQAVKDMARLHSMDPSSQFADFTPAQQSQILRDAQALKTAAQQAA
jgi:hypothetical protein